MSRLLAALRDTGKLFGAHWKLWVPFLVVALLEAAFLGLVWLAPHAPFSQLLAPPLRYFYSDRVLHYPAHLWFMFHVMKHTHVVALTLFGAFFSGIACVMVRQTHQGVPLSFRDALVGREVRYVTMVILWVIAWGLARGVAEAGSMLATPTVSSVIGVIGLTVVLQALLAYAIPAAVYEQAPWWKALGLSMREVMRHPGSTLVIVGVPSIIQLLFGTTINPQFVAKTMMHTQPEIALPFVAIRLVVWTVIDAVMTVSAAHLWLAHREAQPAAAAKPAQPALLRPAKALLGAAMLCCLFVSTGCSESYSGERLFWKAQQLAAPILKDPSKSTPEQFDASHAALHLVIEKAPGTVWAARGQAGIAGLFVLQEKYDEARDAYRLVLQNYGQFKELVLNSRVAIARTYELQQNWPDAIKAYNDIIEYNSWSSVGLQAPLYIALLHERQKDTDQAKKAYERATRLYEKLIPDAPSPEAAAQVKGYLAQAYERLERWDDAIKVLTELLNSTAGVNRPLTQLMLGSIYQTRKNEPQKAGEMYTLLITESPKNPLAKVALVQMKHLGLPLPEGAEEAVMKSDPGTPGGDQAIPPVPALSNPATTPN